MKQELILIKVGEIALKGLNRRTFEDVLMKNIKRHLAPLGKFEVRRNANRDRVWLDHAK